MGRTARVRDRANVGFAIEDANRRLGAGETQDNEA
jgi:hypothetical protein